MANDLEKFLQQAAERLAEKLNQAGQPAQPPQAKPARQPAANRPRQQRNVRQSERARPDPDVVDAELIEPLEPQPVRRLGPDPMSEIDTRQFSTSGANRSNFTQEIDQADERMEGRLSKSLDHHVGNLKDASAALGGAGGPDAADSGSTEVKRRDKKVSPFVEMLRDADSLRSAFIASEIFGRRF